MPAGNKQISIDRYALEHLACGRRDPATVITCYYLDPNPKKLRSVGQIRFYGDRVPLSAYDTSGIVPYFYLNYKIDRYQEIIETLRYEKPIFVSISWDVEGKITSASMNTIKELVGEQEGQGLPS
jgi:hypothetical protein